MGRHSIASVRSERPRFAPRQNLPAAATPPERPGRAASSWRRGATFVGLAFTASVAFLLVNVVDPYSGAVASPEFSVADRFGGEPVQTLSSTETPSAQGVDRGGYRIKEAPAVAPVQKQKRAVSAPPAGVPDPGSAQAYAREALAARGMGDEQFSCLVALWNKESHWNVYAQNPSSGAYGIPQALPGSKMASAGPDWQTSAVTQVNWGLGYVIGRYGTPCGAWGHSSAKGWY